MAVTAYWLSKLFFDLQHDANAYLLRFYFQIRGMPEREFIARLHALQPKQAGKETVHG
jgi:hypothetical protein